MKGDHTRVGALKGGDMTRGRMTGEGDFLSWVTGL
jgi:hypothetical protein